MKRLFAIFVAFFVVLSGCGEPSSPAESDGEKLRVVATIFAPFDFAREIAGNCADVTMLLPPGSEPHSFEPTPQDIINIQSCDVFIYVGGESDEWVNAVLASLDTSTMTIITLMDCVETVEEEIVAGMEHDDEEETAYDEHVWTSPRNAKLIAQKISDALRELDPANSGDYAANTTAYLEKLDALDAEFQAVVDNAARRTVVFGDRFPFRYFADAYGLEYSAAFPGCSAETEASAATVAFLIDKITDEHIPVVFHIELGNIRMASSIAEQTGAEVRLLHACHNISKADFENGKTYISIMSENADALRAALS